jgi:hypothetical protein
MPGEHYGSWPEDARDRMHAYGYRRETYGDDGYGDASYGDDGYGDDTYGEDDEERRGGVRGAAADLAWRYRSAPLWVRVTADVTAAVLALGTIVGVGVALGLRSSGSESAGASGPVVAGDTTTSLATTTLPPTTLPPTTATTEPPTTATTTPPTTVAPTTLAPTATPRKGPPTTRPTTTTTDPPRRPYRSCFEALAAGALPLERGDPGYSHNLDPDGDGHACEPGEWNTD